MNETTMTREEIIGEINALKILLKDSDYVALKVTEALMNGEETAPFAEKIADRKEWRAKLNELEKLLEEMPEPEPEPEPPMFDTEESAEADETAVMNVETEDSDITADDNSDGEAPAETSEENGIDSTDGEVSAETEEDNGGDSTNSEVVAAEETE
ncbi:MAG: hypothetical protein ACI4F7_07715 [Acutalibacteraceae bacterium]